MLIETIVVDYGLLFFLIGL